MSPAPLYAFTLDGQGGAAALGLADVPAAPDPARPYWLHLDHGAPETRTWLAGPGGLDAIAVEALLAEETRPRCTPHGDGVMVFLRGVNMNPGADPEDMVSIRMWIDAGRIITVRMRPLMAVRDMSAALEGGSGPKTPAGVAVYLAENMVARMRTVIEDMDETVDGMEERLIEGDTGEIRKELGEIRREAIVLRRFLSPQREALGRLQAPDIPLFSDLHRIRLREAVDRTQRIIEDLDEVRERAALVQDELANMIGERMNNTVYLLTLVATVMLPLGFLTGLLGINVGGMPGAENPDAFWIVTGALAVLVAIEVWLFKKLKWL